MQVWEISWVVVVGSSVYGWQLGCKSCQKDTNEFYQTIIQSKSLESIHNPSTLFFQWSHIFMHVISHFRRKILLPSRPHVTMKKYKFTSVNMLPGKEAAQLSFLFGRCSLLST